MLMILSFTLMAYLTSCAQMLPGLMADIDDAVTDQAVGITVDKAAMQKDTDVHIYMKIINKDSPL